MAKTKVAVTLDSQRRRSRLNSSGSMQRDGPHAERRDRNRPGRASPDELAQVLEGLNEILGAWRSHP
jgi:hypothetical protein